MSVERRALSPPRADPLIIVLNGCTRFTLNFSVSLLYSRSASFPPRLLCFSNIYFYIRNVHLFLIQVTRLRTDLLEIFIVKHSKQSKVTIHPPWAPLFTRRRDEDAFRFPAIEQRLISVETLGDFRSPSLRRSKIQARRSSDIIGSTINVCRGRTRDFSKDERVWKL